MESTMLHRLCGPILKLDLPAGGAPLLRSRGRGSVFPLLAGKVYRCAEAGNSLEETQMPNTLESSARTAALDAFSCIGLASSSLPTSLSAGS